MSVSKWCFYLEETQQIFDDANDKGFQGNLPRYFLDCSKPSWPKLCPTKSKNMVEDSELLGTLYVFPSH